MVQVVTAPIPGQVVPGAPLQGLGLRPQAIPSVIGPQAGLVQPQTGLPQAIPAPTIYRPTTTVNRTVTTPGPIRTVKECELVSAGTEVTLGMSSFMIGVIVGVIIILVILIIMFAFRGLFFSDVPVNYSTCTSNDYYNDPAVALASTSLHASDILYVQNDQLFYKRVPITRTCTPGPDQTVAIEYPQYCLFERNGGGTQPEEGECNINVAVGRTNGRAAHNTQASYTVDSWHTTVSAAGNCSPVSGAEFGRPLPRWDPFP